jgi:Spy/CpxP family protein refolding chaperone
MKKIILTAVLFAITSLASVQAQNIPQRANNENKNWENNLNLTDAQKQQMKALREDGQKQMKAIKNDNTLTQEQKREKMIAFQKEQRSKRQALLTPEQKAKAETFAKQGRQRGMGMNNYSRFNRFGNNKNGFADRGFLNRWNDLNLTDVQKEKMKTLQEEHQKQMNVLRQQQRTKIMSALTPEQKAKWEERNNDMRKNINRENSK